MLTGGTSFGREAEVTASVVARFTKPIVVVNFCPEVLLLLVEEEELVPTESVLDVVLELVVDPVLLTLVEEEEEGEEEEIKEVEE